MKAWLHILHTVMAYTKSRIPNDCRLHKLDLRICNSIPGKNLKTDQ